MNAYRRVIKHLEEEVNCEDEEDFEKEFFMKHNFMKKCTTSYVVYIQDRFVDQWKRVLERHIEIHKMDKVRTIFKTGDITITLYEKPKKDPRSKLHIQSKDQLTNLEFILEKLSMFYREVCVMEQQGSSAMEFRELQRSLCGKCGKYFTNKKGLKQHMIRMHSSKKSAASKIKTDPSENKLVNDKADNAVEVTTVPESLIGSEQKEN